MANNAKARNWGIVATNLIPAPAIPVMPKLISTEASAEVRSAGQKPNRKYDRIQGNLAEALNI